MENNRLTAYLNLKKDIKTADLRQKFVGKRNELFQMAAISTGLCDSKEDCLKHCPLNPKTCPYNKN